MWNWNGSRWWRVDFHAHSPGSDDYGRGPQRAQLRQIAPREWLLGFMAAGIDCVVIADHNTGEWVDPLTAELAQLRTDRPEGFRDLWLFPGMELSVNGGIHLLAIFAADRTTGDIDTVLGTVRYAGTKGQCDGVTVRSFGEVVHDIRDAAGIPVPAHVDGPDGLFVAAAGETLAQALRLREVVAMEVVNYPVGAPPQYSASGVNWTEVVGSDSHHLTGIAGQNYPGSRFTWIKMGTPSLDGLRLAVMDGPMSVHRSDDVLSDPNAHAALVIESIEVESARYLGRATPFNISFNPWLNAIVGGRGTGKSTLVEFLRLALRRDNEITGDLVRDFEKYGQTYPHRDDPGLLTPETVIRVVYRKDDVRYRIQWAPLRAVPAIEENYETGAWREVEGDVAQRFPVRIYSQKQIFHLAGTPLSLLGTIDDSGPVNRRDWDQGWRELEVRFLAQRAEARELEAGAVEIPRLRGELDDVRQRIEVFERSNHAEVLKAYETARRQEARINAWEEGWVSTGESLRTVAGQIPLNGPVQGDEDDAPLHPEFTELAATPMVELTGVRDALIALADEADQARDRWLEVRQGADQTREIAAAMAAYAGLVEELASAGAGDVSEYGTLVQRRQTIEARLQALDTQRARAAELRNQATMTLSEMLDARRALTARRTDFLNDVLRDNRYVRVRVLPYGSRDQVEPEFRSLLQRDDDAFERDIGSPGTEGLLGDLYADESPEAIEGALEAIKARVQDIRSGAAPTTELRDARFATHVARLNPEATDRLDTWFPEDSLEVQYSTTADGTRFRAIEEASPGQKTAALLAFLLSYGDEPLLLDQPEDDLDNRLIYDLIVTQVREAKRRRQVIVVTHNANVVVNGDAEYVAALVARAGETQIATQGSLQERDVRDMICEVMEGGREAFEQRYRRISLAVQT